MHDLTFHGGRIDAAMRRYPAAPRPWLDLSTGINPFAWDGGVAAADLRALPSVEGLQRLETAAARAMGLAAGEIAALPGSEIGLRLLGGIGLPAPYRFVAPGYRTHGEALPGATPIDVDTLNAEAARGGTVLIANPNNPDGRVIDPARLMGIARTLAEAGGALVIDEAFADAMPGASVLPHLRDGDRVVVLRSFGKFYGLAGVRLGFACGAADLVARIAARLGSWPVSSTAIDLGSAAYGDADWATAMRARLRAARDALDAVLCGHGLAVRGDCPLFALVEDDAADALFARLAAAGLLVRPFDYAPRWLRFGLPADAAALARLDEALRHR